MTATLATFQVGGLLLGLDVSAVQEVLADQVVTPVPLAPAGVLGLVNLRGQLVTAVDARHRLGLDPRGADEPCVHFIIRSDDDVVSLVVDRATEVVDVDEGAYEEVPALVDEAIRTLVTGAYKLEHALLLVLHPGRAVSVTAG